MRLVRSFSRVGIDGLAADEHRRVAQEEGNDARYLDRLQVTDQLLADHLVKNRLGRLAGDTLIGHGHFAQHRRRDAAGADAMDVDVALGEGLR